MTRNRWKFIKIPIYIFFSLRDKYILSALDDQSITFSKVMSVESAIFNSLFTTDQKMDIAVLPTFTWISGHLRHA